LPIVQSGNSFDKAHVAAMLTERFLFILAITIPFDIRDLEADLDAGLKTIPMILNEKRAIILSYLLLLCFFLLSEIHYQLRNEWYISGAIALSALSTYVFLKFPYFRNKAYYHYGILDGTMLLQGILVLVFYYFTHN
jgi:4-hydroxybenzoate polyprenyltransferase